MRPKDTHHSRRKRKDRWPSNLYPNGTSFPPSLPSSLTVRCIRFYAMPLLSYSPGLVWGGALVATIRATRCCSSSNNSQPLYSCKFQPLSMPVAVVWTMVVVVVAMPLVARFGSLFSRSHPPPKNCQHSFFLYCDMCPRSQRCLVLPHI